MKVALPQISNNLTALDDFVLAIRSDETLSMAVVREQDISQLVVRNFTATEIRLEKVNASQAKLEKTSFLDVELANCELTAVNFLDASWHRVAVKSSRCSGLQLQTSELKNVTFVGCKLDLANFRFSKLTNVIFKDCTLEEADFYMAELRDVAFQNCVFEKTEFSGSKLRQVDFRTSDVLGVQGIGSLAGAIIDSSQLITLAPLLASALKIQVKDD